VATPPPTSARNRQPGRVSERSRGNGQPLASATEPPRAPPVPGLGEAEQTAEGQHEREQHFRVVGTHYLPELARKRQVIVIDDGA
jgi:hypothetical protein